MDASRPSLGFPLGTALLLLIIFSLSGVFSCCYHWEKLRALRRSYWEEDADVADMESGTGKTKHTRKSKNVEHKEQCFTVMMPGDKVPKFIAMPCPCQPPRQPEEKLPSPGQKPSKSPGIAVPSY